MKKTKLVAIGTISGLFAACANVSPPFVGRTGSIMAAGSRAILPGGHCESSALLNALCALGYDVTEPDIAGGGGAPSFSLTFEGFPFLGGRSPDMREAFLDAAGIGYRVVVPEAGTDIWQGVIGQLEAGIPVPIRTDMRWLPYRYGGKYGPRFLSFGWHYICLFGIDFDRGLAWVSDTEFPALQAIKLSDLGKARTSKLEKWPPRAEWVALERKPDIWNLDRESVAASALFSVISHYQGKDDWGGSAITGKKGGKLPEALIGLDGLKALPEILDSMDSWCSPWLIAPVLSLMADSIERNGTGGAAFRILFRDFLVATIADMERKGADSRAYRELIPPLEGCIDAWHGLADAFAKAGTTLGKKHDRITSKAAFEDCAAQATILARAETAFLLAMETAK